jgi:hypothetical protein
MPPSLCVPLKREFALSVVLENAAPLLQTILSLPTVPTFALTIPPGVANQTIGIPEQVLGAGFSGRYIGFEHGEVLAEIGVINRNRPGEPVAAYFSGGRSKTSKALVAALAIATARLVGSHISDYSGHWMKCDDFSADDLLLTMTTVSAFDNC